MVSKQLYIIAYDIRKDRSRTRLAQHLEDLGGTRINRSVFELMLRKSQLPKLLARIADGIDPDTDQVAIYPLCRACYGRSHYIPDLDPATGKSITIL